MTRERVDLVIENCGAVTMAGGRYGAIDDAAIAVREGTIVRAGTRADCAALDADERYDAGGGWLTPGLIDCHTHLVYAGDRAHEFEMRLEGRDYAEIARAGGGIVSTVRATRAASEDELVAATMPRLARMISEGVTTVEIKSGYGLDAANEAKLLRAARALGAREPVRVVTTLLAAHAVPPEFATDPDAYVEQVVDAIVPAIARDGLADAVDAFCEGIGFTPAQCARVFDAARARGLPLKLHADQLSDLGGAALAARYGALSADHLEYASEAGIRAMAAAGTVAVLLPGAFYFLRETRLPPVAALRAHGVPIAIATDCNPGSSPLVSPLLAMNMACTLFRLTPEESLAGLTSHAARALGLADTTGTLAAGMAADICLWDIRRPAELAYAIGANPLLRRWYRGSTRVPTPGTRG